MKIKAIQITIVILIILSSSVLLINGLINSQTSQAINDDIVDMNTITNQTTLITTNTNTIKTTKTSKKVVKTTKKVVKKTTTKKVQKFNIKYNKQEIIDYVHKEVVRRWGEEQWEATYQLIMHESGFNPNSVNKKSGACGIFQANPCSKVIKHGYTKYYTDWKEQVRWGLDWITVHKRYGTPKKAWKYWQKYHSY